MKYPSGPHAFPFPGIDVPAATPTIAGKSYDTYGTLYNAFNAGLRRCRPIAEFGGRTCGISDGNAPSSPTYNLGNGYFMGQLNVADIDGDGVDDVLTTYFFRSVVYPGRPKGQIANLGAAQYDNYYNPQGDKSSCHDGRHYGLVALAKLANDRVLDTVNVAGNPVGDFTQPYQNVSRNVAVIKTVRDSRLPTFNRVLLWNRPLNTTITFNRSTDCDILAHKFLYGNAVHYPADAMLRDHDGLVRYIDINRWTQQSPATICDHNDLPCHYTVLASQRGYWSFEVMDVQTGVILKSIPNMYVWDQFAAPAGQYWFLYSANANRWDLFRTAPEAKTLTYRTDLTLGLYDPSTRILLNVQAIPFAATPWLRYTSWSSHATSIASNYEAATQFTVAISGSKLPGIVVKTPTGYAMLQCDGSKWSNSTNYRASGATVH